MGWLDEGCCSFLVILLRELTEGKADAVPNQLVGKSATYSHQ
jgi:hypothetical protein